MARRYRGPAEPTPTTSEFILSRNQLVAEIGDYIARCAALDPAPVEFVLKLRSFQNEVEHCRPDELPAYVDHFEQVKNA